MAITFVSAGTEGGGTGATVTPGLPADIAVGDILVCVAAQFDGGSTVTMAAPWTRIAHQTGNTSFPGFGVFWCRYDGTDPGRAVSFSVADAGVAGIAAFRGCKTSGDPFNQKGGIATAQAGGLMHVGVTTTIGGCMLLACNGTDTNSTRASLASWTPAFEDTLAGTDNSYRLGGSGVSVALAYKGQTSSGVSGDASFTFDGGGSASIMFALEPAPDAWARREIAASQRQPSIKRTLNSRRGRR